MCESDEFTSPRRSARKRRSTYKLLELEAIRNLKMVVSDDEQDEILISDHENDIARKADTVSVSTSLAGKEIYSFDKVKKHERRITFNETPKKDKQAISIPKTPHGLRERINRGIKAKLEEDSDNEANCFSDSGSEYAGTDVSSSSNDETASSDDAEGSDDGNRQTAPLLLRKNNRNQVKSRTHRYVIDAEEYFSSNASKKIQTSNHTLEKLQTPRLSQEQLQKLLAKMTISQQHEGAIVNFTENAKDLFNKWLCLLHEQFNLLLYGLGSKMNILNTFHREMLNNQPVLVINGFFPSLTFKDILDAIIVDLLDLPTNPSNPFDACETIASEFALIPEQHLYIIIHNIEGDSLRNHKSQSVLAKLAEVKNIHLIASIDHINAPLIWDHNKLSKLNFIWWDVTSFLPYTDETSFESSMMIQRTGNLALSSLRNVFLSLTSNSKGIYMILLKYQLAHNTNQYYQGMLFKDLYSACREAFLVSSDLALRAQLTEFVDHKMIKIKRSTDGAEYLAIPIHTNLLQQFLNERNAN